MYHKADSSLDLLTAWRWLFGGQPRLIGWSSSGDLFVADVVGSIARLDTGSGQAETVAESKEELERMLGDAELAETLLLLEVVREFEALNGPLRTRQCLGFATLPALGGSYTVENRYRLPVAEHAAVTGEMHRQLRDIPDGTQIAVKIVP